MSIKKKRGLLASAGALITAVALAFSGAAVANAAPVEHQPEESTVTIHKRELTASQTPGAAANGLVNPDAPGAALAGVTFEAFLITLNGPDAPELGTNVWQERVAALTVENLSTSATVATTAAYTGTTDAQGQIVWNDVPRGVYLVKETGTPAGIVPAADFLLAVPLTHPTQLDQWLDDIHIYPKNRAQNGVKTVENAADYQVGDTIEWSIDLPNPSKSRNTENTAWLATDEFIIFDTIEDEYLTVVADDVVVTTPDGLTQTGADPDFEVVIVAGTGTTATGGTAHAWQASDGNGILEGYSQVQVIFTEVGRDKLAAAKNETPSIENVVTTIPTVVNKQGAIENSAQFRDHTSNTTPKDVPGSEVRYGNAKLVKTSTDSTVTDLSGAEFRVYLSEEAALEAAAPNWGGAYDADTNPNGYFVPTDGPTAGTPAAPTGVFITDAAGEVLIGGLRDSAFANGAPQVEGAPGSLFQRYWLVETKALTGHQLLGEPVGFVVTSDADGVINSPDVEITNSKDGGFELPLTGGTGTALLTILGVGILAFVLVMARRRHAAAE